MLFLPDFKGCRYLKKSSRCNSYVTYEMIVAQDVGNSVQAYLLQRELSPLPK